MNRLIKQKGSVHVVVITVLVAALIFALGWIFWQNFILKEPKTSDTKPVIVKKDDSAQKTKTYTDKTSGVSFDYPGDWSVQPMNMSGSLMVTVTDSTDKPVAYLETKLSGLGGANAGPLSNTLLATAPLSGHDGSYVCAIAANVGENMYELAFGTSTEELCAKSVDATGPGGAVIPVIDTKSDNLGVLSFSNIDYMSDATPMKFSSLDAAKHYIASDEYKQIQAMVGSLKY